METINVGRELAEIRARIEARLSRTVPEIPELTLPPLEPLRQVRGLAESWSGALGGVNHRGPGLLNDAIQLGKKAVARGMRWFTFPQGRFNSAMVAALVRIEEMFADNNHNMVIMGQAVGQARQAGPIPVEDLPDLRQNIRDQAQRLTEMEARIEALNTALLDANRERDAAIETFGHHLRLSVEDIHGNVARGLSDGFMRTREELGAEVRLIRQRMAALGAAGAAQPAPAATAAPGFGQPSAPTAFDYAHFENRFRGSESDVRAKLTTYLPLLQDQAPVLDVACGRGEMLALLRENQISASGVDLDLDMVAYCEAKGLSVVRGDALAYLESQPEGSLGAVFSSQFVEHLAASAYARLIELSFARLRPGGRIILETQNPECLVIYSQSFFLDPTHVKPIPAEQLRFLLEEAGFRDVRVHYLSPVEATPLPRLPLLPAETPGGDTWNWAAAKFNKTYFGHMDYAVSALKP